MIAQPSPHPVWSTVSVMPLNIDVAVGRASSLGICLSKLPGAGRNLVCSEGNKLWLLWSIFTRPGINQLWKAWVSSNHRRERVLSRMWESLQTAACWCGNSEPEEISVGLTAMVLHPLCREKAVSDPGVVRSQWRVWSCPCPAAAPSRRREGSSGFDWGLWGWCTGCTGLTTKRVSWDRSKG